jgi:hypothetical protein
MSDQTHSRAGALRRIGLLLGGAGLGAAGGFVAKGETEAKGNGKQAAAQTHATRLRLRASQLAYSDPDATPMNVVRTPSRLIATAHLLDEAGSARGTCMGIVMPAGEGGLELHTFTLDGGTLMGIGPASASSFSIVGATGAYAGAGGGYTMEHRAASAGGDGSADFVIDIARGERPWH